MKIRILRRHEFTFGPLFTPVARTRRNAVVSSVLAIVLHDPACVPRYQVFCIFVLMLERMRWGFGVQAFRRSGAIALTVALLATLITAISGVNRADAADGSQFSDGNIISDAVFFNGASMSAAEVQAFLNSKVSSCASGYVCLKNYTETTTDIAANPMCSAYAGGPSESAATMIAKVGAACGISQKVLLATLEKEQGLVTSTGPSSSRYAAAMGALCPDTAPCDSAASGFFKQLYTGAYLFKRYTQPAGTGAGTSYSTRYDLMYPVGQTSSILYQVASQPSCGSKNVFVQNQATHVLYVYTPYTPNAAALANMYGTGDTCSAYGNRNFWRNFTDWFGSTQVESSELTGVYAIGTNGNLTLYRGNGRGSWANPVQVGNGWGAMTSATAVGDYTHDGKRDVVALDSSGRLWVYPTDGATGWGTPVIIDSGWDSRSSVLAAGDFDENGTNDVFVRDPAGDFWLVRGDGSTGITSKSKVGSGWTGFDQLTGGIDWNGDGHTDVIARASTGDLIVFYGNGAGGWLGSARIGTGWQGFAWVSGAGDFDGDGAQDVVAALGDGRLFLYTGNGVGSWKSSAQVGVGWTGMRSVFGFGPNPTVRLAMQPGLGDVNSDAARDVLAWGDAAPSARYAGRGVISRSGSGELFLSQPSGGAWTGSTSLGTGWNGAVQVLGVGDVTRDNQPDILSLDTAGTLRAYPTNGTAITGSPATLATGWPTNTLLIDGGDFDGNGIQDLITRDGNGDLWLSSGSSSGGFGARSKIGTGWNVFDTVLGVGDWDGDNAPDLLGRTPAGGLFLYCGNGAGSWKSSRQIGVGWQVLGQLTVVGDWNGDGKTDIAGRGGGGNVVVYFGNGAGGWSGVADAGTALSAQMFSGSGSLGQVSTKYSVYLGSGRSSWKGSSSFVASGLGQLVTPAGDTNGDGQKELVWRDGSGNLISQGYSTAGTSGPVTVKASDASSANLLIGAGDFSGDGLADVITRDGSGNLWLYKGTTGAQFATRTQIGNGWNVMSNVVGVGDFSGDGKADLLAISTTGEMYLYTGNGQSGFTESSLIGNGWSGMDVVFSPGDFNGDRKPDLLARQRGSGALFLFIGNGAGALSSGGIQVGRGWNIFNGIG